MKSIIDFLMGWLEQLIMPETLEDWLITLIVTFVVIGFIGWAIAVLTEVF